MNKMNLARSSVALTAVMSLASACVSHHPVVPRKEALPRKDAEKVVRASIRRSYYEKIVPAVHLDRIDLQITDHGGSLGAERHYEYHVALEKPPMTYECSGDDCVVGMPTTAEKGGPPGTETQFDFGLPCSSNESDDTSCNRVAAALSRLVRDAGRVSDSAGAAEFEQQAVAWRATNPKPRLSDEGDRNRILAESAFREKELDDAIGYFLTALETDRTWPDGNFNVALLLADNGDIGAAAYYMKRFLILVPDGKDSVAAHEKIVVWEEKAKAR